MNIGQLITWLILNTKKSNDEILKAVHEKFPTCKTTGNCVAWYKTKLRKAGLIEKGAGKFHVELSEEDLEALK